MRVFGLGQVERVFQGALRRQRGGRRVRVIVGEPQYRGGDARLPAFAVVFVESGEGLLGLR
jgi:hypothetical protein